MARAQSAGHRKLGAFKRGAGRPRKERVIAAQPTGRQASVLPAISSVSREEAIETVRIRRETATTNDVECLLSDKVGNQSGYVQSYLLNRKPALRKAKKLYVLHRLAIIAHGSKLDQRRMLNGWHVSHLCHQKNCFNYQHLVVESKAANEARKRCKGRAPVVKAEDGEQYPPPHRCQCTGRKCISMVEFRRAAQGSR